MDTGYEYNIDINFEEPKKPKHSTAPSPEDLSTFRGNQLGGYQGAPEQSMEFNFAPADPRENTEKDYLEGENRLREGVQNFNIDAGDKIPVIWSMTNVQTERSKNALEVARGNKPRNFPQDQYQAQLTRLGLKYGEDPNAIANWYARDDKGFIVGFVEQVNHLRDVLFKSAGATAGIVATSTAYGAGAGLLGGGAGAAPGAIAGAGAGLVVAGKTAVPLATLQDTYTKEAGSFIADQLEKHPDMSDDEFKRVRNAAAISGAASAVLETAEAAILLPYLGKFAKLIPGVNKITAKMQQQAAKEATKNFTKFISTENGKAFFKDLLKITSAELTTEELQTGVQLYAENYIQARGEADVKARLQQAEAGSPEYYALVEELNRRQGERITKEQVGAAVISTAKQTIQGVGIFALLGAGAASRARVHTTVAGDINSKMESEQESQLTTKEETMVLKGGVEENVLADASPEQLQKSFAEQNIRIKELDNQIATTEARIESASELGLGEGEISQLKLDLDGLTQQKDAEVSYLKKIGTERAIKQATEETNSKLEKVNQSIEKVNSDIESTQEKINVAEKEGKATESLKAKLSDLESKLTGLETNQEKLLKDQVKLEKREGVEEVLRGKKTSIPSTTLANIETRAEEAVAKADAKAATRINNIMNKNATGKLNALIKSEKAQADQYVRGYAKGAKEQIRETKDIRKTLYSTLRSAGIKRKELSNFDSITKNIVTVNDLINNKEKITQKVQEVYEARNKEIALKVTDKLRKLAKPLKAGKTPKGKMTADIQNKVNRLFSFTQKKIFEIGFDIKELYERFSSNPEQGLSARDKAQVYTAENESIILRNQEQINALKSDKEKSKIKWEGANKKREGRISADEVSSAVKDFTVEKPEESMETFSVETDIKNHISKVLNVINMGFSFKELTVRVKDSVFTEDNKEGYSGRYIRDSRTIEVRDDAKFSLTHELGHFFDTLLNSMFSEDHASLFSDNRNITDPALKATMQKFSTMVKAERSRTEQHSYYKNLKVSKEYVGSNSEIFARIFHALSNKINGTVVEPLAKVDSVGELVYEMTRTMPEKTLNDFKSVLNDLAKYKEVGAPIRELEKENEALESKNEKIRKNLKGFSQITMDRYLPETIADLVYELELAADLKSKTSTEIMKFNEHVAMLIQEGRDERKQKIEAKKEAREKKIQTLLSKVNQFAPKSKDGKLHTNVVLDWYNIIAANWKSKLNIFFGKDIAEEFNIIAEEAQREAFVFEEKEKFRKKAQEVYKFNKRSDLSKMLVDYLQDITTVVENIKEGTQKVRINKLQIISAWTYYQNEIGRARLENMFEQEQLDYMFSKLSNEDLRFSELLIETAGSYYETVNTIFREDRGLDLPKRQNYFPFISEAEATDLPTFMDSSFGTVKGLPSFTKDVTPSKNVRLNLGNPISTLFTHIQNVGEYVNVYAKTNELNIMFNDERVKEAIRYNYGERNLKSFMSSLQDISLLTRVKENILATNLFDKLASNYIVAKIALKPTIAIKQVLSFINYLENVPLPVFMKYQAEFFANPKKAIDFMMQDKYLQARFKQGSEAFELSKAMETSTYAKSGKFMDWLTLNVRVGDMGAIVLGGYSQVKYLMNEKRMSKGEAFTQFREDTADSQQFNSTSSLSNLQNYARRNALARMFFAFTNTPFQYHRKFMDAAIQASRGEMGKEQFLKQVMIYQVINPFLYNTATSLSPLMLALSWDDEDKREEALKEMLVQDMLGGILTGNSSLLPVVGEIPSQVYRQATGAGMYKPDSQFFAQETYDIIKTSSDTLSLISQGDFEDIDAEEVWDSIVNVGEIWQGLPLDYATNAVEGVVQLRDEETRLQGLLKMAGYSNKRSEDVAKLAE